MQEALSKTEQLLGHPLIDGATENPATGEIATVVTIVYDNGGTFRPFVFETFITGRPKLTGVRTGAHAWPERVARTRVRGDKGRMAVP